MLMESMTVYITKKLILRRAPEPKLNSTSGAVFCVLGVISVLAFYLLPDISPPSFGRQSKQIPIPFALIDVHASGSTLHKNQALLEKLHQHPLVKSKVFKIRLCISKNVTTYFPFTTLRMDCGDGIWPGYNCRIQTAFVSYVNDYPTIPWNLKICDDTLLNLDNLYDLLYNLYQVYDPFTELVFRAHAHLEKKILVFPHGGAGWIWSYAWCKFQSDPYYDLEWLYWKSRYRQDDTAEQIILRHVFNESRFWDEYHFVGFQMAADTDVESIERRQWDKLPPCNVSEEHGRVNKIISLHTFGNYWNTTTLQKAVFAASDDVYYARHQRAGRISVCYSKDTLPFHDYTVESIRANTIKLKEAEMPKYIFNRDLLPDDNSNERHGL